MKNITNYLPKKNAPESAPVITEQTAPTPMTKRTSNKTSIRPEFSNDDRVRLKKIQVACELVYGRRLSVAEMFFAMLDKHITEDYPEIVPYIKQFDELEKNNK